MHLSCGPLLLGASHHVGVWILEPLTHEREGLYQHGGGTSQHMAAAGPGNAASRIHVASR